jgi:hypothetical protein
MITVSSLQGLVCEQKQILHRIRLKQDRLDQDYELQRLYLLATDDENCIHKGLRFLEDSDSNAEILAALKDFA